MKKISNKESEIIIREFLNDLELSIRNNVEIVLEYIELEIDEKFYEKINCAYFQNEDASKAILYEVLMQRFFYIETEKISNTEKIVPHLFLLDSSVEKYIPKRIQDKFLSVLQNHNIQTLQLEDFGINFKITRP